MRAQGSYRPRGILKYTLSNWVVQVPYIGTLLGFINGYGGDVREQLSQLGPHCLADHGSEAESGSDPEERDVLAHLVPDPPTVVDSHVV